MESEMLSGFVSNYVQLKVNNIYSHCGIFRVASWRISKDYAQKYKLVLCRVGLSENVRKYFSFKMTSFWIIMRAARIILH